MVVESECWDAQMTKCSGQGGGENTADYAHTFKAGQRTTTRKTRGKTEKYGEEMGEEKIDGCRSNRTTEEESPAANVAYYNGIALNW